MTLAPYLLPLLLGLTDPSWLQMEASASSQCVDPARIEQVAQDLLGEGDRLPPTHVEVEAERIDTRWQVSTRIEAPGLDVQRTFEASECASISEAIGVVIAVHISPIAVARTVVPKLEPEPEPEPKPKPEPEPEPELKPEPEPRAGSVPPRLTLGAQVGGEIGVLPRGGPFAELTVGAAWPSWRVELSGLGSVGLEGYTTRRSQLGVDMNLVALAARGCWVPHKDRIEVPICAAAEAGRLQARGRGLQRPEVASALWLAATVGVRPRWAVAKRVAIGADVEMVVPFLHHRFVSTDAGELYALGPVAGRFTAGIEIRLF